MDTSGNVVFDYEVTGSAVSSIDTGSILNGNADGVYTIIYRFISGANSNYLDLTFNSDTGNNYGHRAITAGNTTVANNSNGDVAAPNIYLTLSSVTAANNTTFGVHKVYAKSGSVRLVNGYVAVNVTGTTITSLSCMGNVWNNTNDNLVSMQFTSYVAGNYLAAGTRIIILKGNALAVGTSPGTTGAWKRVGTSVLGATASSISFTGLTGNTAICYYLSTQIKNSYNGSTQYDIRFNSDGGAKYGHQRLLGRVTTVSADRGTGMDRFYLPAATATNLYCASQILMFAKSGFLRPIISQNIETISGTTIAGATVYGNVWDNTANELTQIDIASDRADEFAAGSQFDLYALYT